MSFSNIDVMDTIRKLVIILSAQTIVFKIINEKNYFSINKVLGYIMLIVLEPLIELINNKTNFFNSTVVLIFVISVISNLITRKKIGYNIFLTIISLACSYAIYFGTLIIVFFINKIIGLNNDIVNAILIIIINITIIFAFFRIKKFKYGIVSLQDKFSNEYIDVLILSISVGILAIGVIFYNRNNFINVIFP